MTGQKLRLFREYRNYSQVYIADQLGITQNAYSRIENNQTRLTADRLGKLAMILNVPLLELLSEKVPVLQFSETSPLASPAGAGAAAAATTAATAVANDERWKEMIENTRLLYSQVICSKDEKIAHLENEISCLRKEKDRIIHLLEKLTDGKPMPAGAPS